MRISEADGWAKLKELAANGPVMIQNRRSGCAGDKPEYMVENAAQLEEWINLGYFQRKDCIEFISSPPKYKRFNRENIDDEDFMISARQYALSGNDICLGIELSKGGPFYIVYSDIDNIKEDWLDDGLCKNKDFLIFYNEVVWWRIENLTYFYIGDDSSGAY